MTIKEQILKLLFRPGQNPRVRRKRTVILKQDPYLQKIWNDLAQKYFPQITELNNYTVCWSPRRQKRVLASVSLHQKKVRVAKELNDPDLTCWHEPLLYHEMCHAVLGLNVPVRNRKKMWHGNEFKFLEQQHPEIHNLEKWIRSGGWSKAVRSSRTKEMWLNKKSNFQLLK